MSKLVDFFTQAQQLISIMEFQGEYQKWLIENYPAPEKPTNPDSVVQSWGYATQTWVRNRVLELPTSGHVMAQVCFVTTDSLAIA